MTANDNVFAPQSMQQLFDANLVARLGLHDRPPVLLIIDTDCPGPDGEPLDKLTKHLRSNPDPTPILTLRWEREEVHDWLTDSAPWVVAQRLPQTLYELRQLLEKAAKRRPDNAQWNQLVRAAHHRQLERLASVARHDYRGYAAAVRIYLGALIGGSADKARAADLLSSFRDRQFAPNVDEHTLEFIQALNEYVEFEVRAGSQVKRPGTSRIRRRAVMIDDNFVKQGWDRVLGEIFERSIGGTDWAPELASELEVVAGDHSPILLLDCGLGDPSKPCGIEWLAAARERSLVTPIVLMTAFDDAELATWSLRHGASHFYAKELTSVNDRNSAMYYERFRRLTEGPRWAARLGELWDQFKRFDRHLGALCGGIEPQNGWNADRDKLDLFLRISFYSLLSLADGFEWWHSGSMPGGRSATDACVKLAATALAHSEPILSTGMHPFRQHERHPDTRDLLRIRHGGEADVNRVLNALEDIVLVTNGHERKKKIRTDQPRMPSPGTYSRVELNGAPGSRLLAEQAARDRQHSESIERLCLAADCVPPCNARLLVIHAEPADPLFCAFIATVFPNSLILSEMEQNDLDLFHFDCALFDLRAATWERTIEDLARARCCDPTLPIVTTSVSGRSQPAIRALKLGAVAYVPRYLYNRDDERSWIELVSRLRETVQEAAELGRSRQRGLFRHREPFGEGELSGRVSRSVGIVRSHPDARRPGHAVIPQDPGRVGNSQYESALLLWHRFGLRSELVNFKLLHYPDPWRLEQMGLRADQVSSLLAKHMFPTIIENWIKWLWMIENERPLPATSWGSRAEPRIPIEQTIRDLGGHAAVQLWLARFGRLNGHEVLDLFKSATSEIATQFV